MTSGGSGSACRTQCLQVYAVISVKPEKALAMPHPLGASAGTGIPGASADQLKQLSCHNLVLDYASTRQTGADHSRRALDCILYVSLPIQ
jgi:hypothetical protein